MGQRPGPEDPTPPAVSRRIRGAFHHRLQYGPTDDGCYRPAARFTMLLALAATAGGAAFAAQSRACREARRPTPSRAACS